MYFFLTIYDIPWRCYRRQFLHKHHEGADRIDRQVGECVYGIGGKKRIVSFTYPLQEKTCQAQADDTQKKDERLEPVCDDADMIEGKQDRGIQRTCLIQPFLFEDFDEKAAEEGFFQKGIAQDDVGEDEKEIVLIESFFFQERSSYRRKIDPFFQ